MFCSGLGKEVFFDPIQHKYTDIAGQPLTGVSHLIDHFKRPFDPYGSIAKACAKREGITVEQMRKKWDDIATEGKQRGSRFHKAAEKFLLTGQIEPGPDADIIEKLSKIKFEGTILCEQVLHSLKHKLAGTADLICFTDHYNFDLGDFKTNKKFLAESPYGKKLLPPLQELDDCEVNVYGIQLSLYAFMLEEQGYWANNLTLYYINPEKRDIDIYPVTYRRQMVKDMLEAFHNPPEDELA